MHAEHAISTISEPENGRYDAIILAVAHRQFVDMGATAIRALGKPDAIVYDIKGVLGKAGSDLRL